MKAIAIDNIREMWKGSYMGSPLTMVIFDDGTEKSYSIDLYEKSYDRWKDIRAVIEFE